MTRICKYGFEKVFKEEQPEIFGMSYTQHVLSGRWKFLVLWFLKKKEMRFGELKMILNDISQGSLTKQLRELEKDGLIIREVFPEVPPKVVYSLSDKGREFVPILDMMEEFGRKFGETID